MKLPRHYYENDFLGFEEYLASYSHQVLRYKYGEKLFSDLHFTTEDKFFYYIRTGLVVAYGMSEDGRRKTVSYYGKASFPIVDLEPYIFNTYSIIHMDSLSDETVLYLYDRDTLYSMLQHNFQFTLAMLNFSSEVASASTYQEISLSLFPVEMRLCDFLYLTYLNPPRANTAKPGTIQISQDQIASFVGASRMQVSRIVAGLKAEHIVKTMRGQIQICDVDGLRRKCSTSVSIYDGKGR